MRLKPGFATLSRIRTGIWLCCILLIWAGCFAVPQRVVNSENSSSQSVEAVMYLGRGEIKTSAWGPDGTTIAIGSSRGVWLYTADLNDIDHWGQDLVMDLDWHPSGAKLVTLGQTGVTIWATTDLEPQWNIMNITTLGGWNSDGSLLAVQASDKNIQIWDDRLQNIVAVCETSVKPDGPQPPVLAWSPTDDRIALLSGREIHLCDASTGHIEVSIPFPEAAFRLDDIAWSPDGTTLAVGGEFGIWIWDVNGQLLQYLDPGSPQRMNAIAWMPDGTHIAGTTPTSILIWELQNAVPSYQIRLTTGEGYGGLGHNEFRQVAWNPDGRRLLTTTTGGLQVVDSLTGIEIASSYLHTGPVNALDWNLQNQLAAGYGDRESTNKGDHRIRIWDGSTGALLQACLGCKGPINVLEWTSLQTEVISGGGGFYQQDGRVLAWDTTTCESSVLLDTRMIAIPSLALSPDGTHIAVDLDSVELLCDIGTLDECDVLDDFSLVSWAPNGTQLAGRYWGAQGGTQVVLYDLLTKHTHMLEGHTGVIRSVSWSPDGSMIASGADDGTIRLWDVETRRESARLEGHREAVLSVAWNWDGSMVASGSEDHTVRVWDTGTGELVSVLEDHDAAVTTIAWNPATDLLAGGSADGIIIIWEVTGG